MRHFTPKRRFHSRAILTIFLLKRGKYFLQIFIYTPFANDTAILNDWNLGFNSDANLISAVSLAKRV
jgi:hypothetical protein